MRLRAAPGFFGGTLAPLLRASDKPMAIACLRLLTVRPEPLLSDPRFWRRMALATDLLAVLPYFAIRFSLQAWMSAA